MIDALTRTQVAALKAIRDGRYIRTKDGYRMRGAYTKISLATVDVLRRHRLVQTVFYGYQNQLQITHEGHKELAERDKK